MAGSNPRAWLVTGLLGSALAAAAAGIGADAASAQQRMMTVNGYWLNPQEIAIADLSAGFRVPDGHYLCDPATGYWGLPDGTIVGRVPPSYCPPLPGGGGGGGSYLHRGPGGTTGGSGDCFYYNDPETGSSVMSDAC